MTYNPRAAAAPFMDVLPGQLPTVLPVQAIAVFTSTILVYILKFKELWLHMRTNKPLILQIATILPQPGGFFLLTYCCV